MCISSVYAFVCLEFSFKSLTQNKYVPDGPQSCFNLTYNVAMNAAFLSFFDILKLYTVIICTKHSTILYLYSKCANKKTYNLSYLCI